jgi:hypothetical protein
MYAFLCFDNLGVMINGILFKRFNVELEGNRGTLTEFFINSCVRHILFLGLLFDLII